MVAFPQVSPIYHPLQVQIVRQPRRVAIDKQTYRQILPVKWYKLTNNYYDLAPASLLSTWSANGSLTVLQGICGIHCLHSKGSHDDCFVVSSSR